MSPTFDRAARLPEFMQGRWVDADDLSTMLVIDGGEVSYCGMVVEYDHKEITEMDGATTVSLMVDDLAREDDFQRANITGLVRTPEGEFHAYNVRFASQLVRATA